MSLSLSLILIYLFSASLKRGLTTAALSSTAAAVLVFRLSIIHGRDHATIYRSIMAVLPLLVRPVCRCFLFLSGLLFPLLRLLLVLFLLVGVESPLLSSIGLVHKRLRLPSLMIWLLFLRGWRCCLYPSSLLGSQHSSRPF